MGLKHGKKEIANDAKKLENRGNLSSVRERTDGEDPRSKSDVFASSYYTKKFHQILHSRREIGYCKINVTFYSKRFDKRLGEWYIGIKVTKNLQRSDVNEAF